MQPAIETETQNSQRNRKLKPHVCCHFLQNVLKESQVFSQNKIYNFAFKDSGTLKLAIKSSRPSKRYSKSTSTHPRKK